MDQNARNLDSSDPTAQIPLVIVCDEREMFRRGLHQMLSSVARVSAVRSYRSLGQACEGLANPVDSGTVGILDCMTAAGEPGSMRQLERFGVRLLVLLADCHPARLELAAELPASGYLLEEGLSVANLASVLDRAMAAELPLPAAMADFLLGRLRSPTRPPSLTDRQLVVVQMMASGATNGAIAEELGLSVHAVKRQVAGVLIALGCANRTQAAAKALRAGLIPGDAEHSW